MKFPDLAGRTAFVTGAASGIGRAIAATYAAFGARVTCADLDKAGAQSTVAEIEAAGGVAEAVGVDVSSRAEVDQAVDAAVARWGRLDVLCNAAGIFIDVTPSAASDTDLSKVMQVNYMGSLYASQAAVRHMRPARSGSIVNLSTGGLDKPRPEQLAYVASKAAVTELTRCLALEVGAANIRVNAIAAGYIDTPMIRRNYVDDNGTLDEARWNETLDNYRSLSPLGMVGEPMDVAWAALYLATDMSRFTTGQTLRPNGGFVMPR
ncbi:SDR family NAD(P)-dependent oxidoreductase [Arthrobacter mobilis]|uniref:SDR family NAD(P)-dependent oxidoreductase n=1 Tax=Arthrobacter mobilis TaxID=2724944 RepID=UPI00197B79E2|nr:SDR family NAD(P)-dependent oxidoreductase [Arthrobacter mobilis]